MDIRRHKLIILFFSFIFIGAYSAALVYAVTYVTPGSVLDPTGTPGNYTVGFATAANEVLYTNGSNQLASDDGFLRKPTLIDQPDQTIGTTAFSEVSNTADSDNISLVGIGGGLIVTDNFNRGVNDTYIGIVGEVIHQGTGTLSTADGNLGVVINSSTGIISDARGSTSVVLNIGGGTLTNGYAFYAGTIQATNKYGVYIDADDTVNVLRELQLRQESPLKLFDGDSSNYVAFKAPNSLISNTIYEWPDGYGNSGDVLTSDGVGGLSWQAGGGGSSVQTAHITLSSADILGMNGTPVQLIAAPGASKVIQPLGIFVDYHFGTVRYDNGGGGDPSISIKSTNAVQTLAIDSTTLGKTQDAQAIIGIVGGVDTGAINDALIVTSDAVPLNGDGTLDIYVTYVILDL